MRTVRLFWILGMTWLALTGPVLAQAATPAATQAPAARLDPVNLGLGPMPEDVHRSTPRNTVIGFLTACREGRFATAAHYLDLEAYPASVQRVKGARLARRFKIVLDRTFWVNPEAIPDEPEPAAQKGLGPDVERLTTLDLKGSKVDILLQHRHLADRGDIWVFHRATVAAIDPLYQQDGFGWLGDHLPAFFFTIEVGEVQLWQWLGLVLLLSAGLLLSRAVTPRLMRGLRSLANRTAVGWDDAFVDALDGPARLGILAAFLFFAVPWLGLSEPATRTVGVVWKLVAVIFLGWLLSRWVEIAARVLRLAAVAKDNDTASNFIPIFARIMKVGVWALAIVVGLDSVGLRVMGLVAGLGIGGVVVAFAAQKTVENLFGSLAIAADRPFRIGDFVKIGDILGTVEEVGLRSTRVRTLDRTVVTIPNGPLISERVENYGLRDRFLYRPTIGLLYDSTKEQLEFVIDEIKKLLVGHPKVWQEVVRVRLVEFGAYSINIGIFAWLLAVDYAESTALAEELNFKIFEIVAASGSGFAFPSQTLYLGRDGGIDSKRAESVGSEVSRRRASGELWIPEPPAAQGDS
jgi:MscS family membrane protein